MVWCPENRCLRKGLDQGLLGVLMVFGPFENSSFLQEFGQGLSDFCVVLDELPVVPCKSEKSAQFSDILDSGPSFDRFDFPGVRLDALSRDEMAKVGDPL